jgi:two-component system, LytTR family, response regulator
LTTISQHVKLKALIVDDEPLARENLAMLIADYCPEVEVVGMAEGVADARKKIKSLQPQVVFLDIRMPSGAEGFDLLEELNDHPFLVVFVTAFKDYAIKAFNANAVHYILKPIDIDDLKSAIAKLVQQAKDHKLNRGLEQDYAQRLDALASELKQMGSSKAKRIAIHHSKGIRLVSENEIVFVQAEGNCSFIQLSDQSRILDTQTLKVYEELLNPQQFLRVHRSYLINLEMVKEFLRFPNPTIVMRGGHQIPVSRQRLSDFVSAISSTQ